MRIKLKKYFILIPIYSVFCVILYTYISYYNRKELFELDFKEDLKLPNEKYSEEKVQYSKLNVSNQNKYTDNIKKLEFMSLNVTSKCTGISFPSNLATKDSWRATDGQNTAYVFNAYLEHSTHQIVIVGIKEEGGPSTYFCQFWNRKFGSHTVEMEEKPAQVVILPEGHQRRYEAVLIQCMLSPSAELPTHVSIVTGSCETPINMFDIQTLKKPTTIKRRFTVCLTPLNFRYNRDYEIIEWIELNKLLGAEKFIIYNYSSAFNVKHVLEYYSQRSLAEVVQWDLPVGVDTWPRENKTVEIHYFGQVAALHDCLYRNKGVSEFIVNLDLDEFIIPHGENVNKWSEMLTQLEQDAEVYMFRNTFFKKEWNNAGIEIQNQSLVDKLRFVTLQKLQHETIISPPTQRSKYFAKADKVSRVMIHEVPSVRNLHVPVEIGLVHHYRDWETRGDPPHVKVLDNTVPRKYGHHLIRNVQKVWSDLGKRLR